MTWATPGAWGGQKAEGGDPQRCPHPNPENLLVHHVQSRKDSADEIK